MGKKNGTTARTHKKNKKRIRVELRKKSKWQRIPGEVQESFTLHTDHGKYYAANMAPEEAKGWKGKAKRYKLKYLSYDAEFLRSSYYRTKFLKNKGSPNKRYRCVYCGKKMKEEDMTVDHVISIKAAQSSAYARFLLRRKGGIDDIRNLVPSCARCNNKKGDSISLHWRLKAAIGQHASYWAMKKILLMYIYLAVLLAFWKYEELIPYVQTINTTTIKPLLGTILDLWQSWMLPFTVKVQQGFDLILSIFHP